MVTFAPIERTLDVLAQQWRVDKVEQVEAADDIVVFPKGLASLVFPSIGVEFVDDDTLSRGFQRQRDENSLQVIPFFHDQIGIEFAYWFQNDVAIMIGVLEAIERRAKFLLDLFIARCELITEDMQQSKIHLVCPVSVSGMNLRVNVRGIVEEQIEDKLALMIVGTDHIGVHRDMIGNQSIGHHTLWVVVHLSRMARSVL